jgi:signal recognition particle receptor subunit alpha
MAALDYSTPPPSSPTANGAQTPSGSSAPAVDVDSLVDKTAFGTRGKDGLYEVADWDAGRRGGPPGGLRGAALLSEEEIIAKGYLSGNKQGSSRAEATAIKEDAKEETTGALSSLLSRLTTMTSSKTLTKEDLTPVLQEMEKHLMSKNVAKDIAEKLCESVGNTLVGRKLGGFGSESLAGTVRAVRHWVWELTANPSSCFSQGVKSEVNSALSAAITRVLTPKTSTDILLDIKRKSTATTRSVTLQSDSPLPKDPYTMTFVGVNGVGKSTNLSKVCFWLLQNRLRVLIAACDTFRSGAVEQLRVHVRNLGMLGDQLGTVDGEVAGNKVELYERGYGKDAAGIAKDAIAYGEFSESLAGRRSRFGPGTERTVVFGPYSVAKENGFDVVLIDTAGRMQDNEPLMRALAKVRSHDPFAFLPPLTN